MNTFQWGPDGRLYGLHGIFTNSEVKPEQADGPGTRLNGGIWRYDTKTKKFEIFAEGTSNPWGMDWRNTDGQFILCCCVIPHLYHIVPGGVYKRQAGQSFNPYAYGEIKEICDHTFHKESGWAHAGLISLDTPLMPEKYRNSVIFGSIHGCSIKQNILKKNGSTYTASRGDDFLVSGDKNFRPINLRWGHNGEIYCIDWHDQNPCHQAGADSWDYEHGRVFRIQRKGMATKKAEDLGAKPDAVLAALIRHDNPYLARTALRLLGERRPKYEGQLALAIQEGVQASNLPSLWLGFSLTGKVNILVDRMLSPAIRAWSIRLNASNPTLPREYVGDMIQRAAKEQDPAVRRELASAAIRLADTHDTKLLVHWLMERKEDTKDPMIPQLLWLAYERRLAQGHLDLDWLRDNAAGNPLITDTIVPNTMRRLASGGKPEDLKACLAFAGELKDMRAKRKALAGLMTALKGRQVDAPDNWKPLYAVLLKEDDAETKKLAQALAINFRDAAAARTALSVARDPKKPKPERVAAVRELAVARIDEARQPLLDLLLNDKDGELRQEVCRALAGYDGNDIPNAVLRGWKDYPPGVRVEAVNLLASRKEWARELLNAVGDKRVARTDLTDNTILRINAFKDKDLDARIKSVWGLVRSTPDELNKLIDSMRAELHKGPASFERGRKVFDNQCAKCHKFDGRGSSVGPELDGAGRDIEYLLVNILDPNRVVGAPYFQRVVRLNNGQVYVGLLAAEDKDTVSLKSENDAVRVLLRKDIEKLEVVERSMMPEGLDKTMTVQDFRDLVRYVMASPFLTDVELASSMVDPKWAPLSVGVPGRILLPKTKERQEKALIRGRFTATEAFRTRLLLGGGVSVRVSVNGKKVYEGVTGTGSGPDQTAIDVELRKDGNEVVIEAMYPGDKDAVIYTRVLDPNRKIRYPEAKDK